jgi:hypothetical protein
VEVASVVTAPSLMLITPPVKHAAYTTPVTLSTETPTEYGHCAEVATVAIVPPLMLMTPPPAHAAYTTPVTLLTDTPRGEH